MNNFFKSTMRFFWRQRLFTILNVMGLAIGISASWVIYRIVDYEFSFDRNHPQKEQIYQLIPEDDVSVGALKLSYGIDKGVLPFLLENVSGLDAVVPVYEVGKGTGKVPGKELRLIDGPKHQIGTLPSYFDLVPYRWLAGDPSTALSSPDRVVLTRSRTVHYFPDVPMNEVIGKTITYSDTNIFIVSGVVDDLEYLSSFGGQEFFSISDDDKKSDNWSTFRSDIHLYLKVSKGVSPELTLALINKEANKHIRTTSNNTESRDRYKMMPLSEKHFADPYSGRTANKKVLYGLMAIAAFLLSLACINYINLTAAQLPSRAKQIGIRKTLGGSPNGLIYGFFGETLLICLMAVPLSFLLSQLAFVELNNFIPEGLTGYINYPNLIIFGLTLILTLTLLSSFYPAYLIQRIQTVQVLKGQTEQFVGMGRYSFRKALIVFQFVIAQIFVVSSIIMSEQLRYGLNKDLGFNYEAVITVNLPSSPLDDTHAGEKHFALKQEFQKHPDIAEVAFGDVPMANALSTNTFIFQSDTGEVQQQLMLKNVDVDYIDLYDISLLAGRNFQVSDTTREYIINEVARKSFGFQSPEDAIGKQLISWDKKSLAISGVVADFHQFSLKSGIDPTVFITQKPSLSTLNIKLNPTRPAEWTEAIRRIETVWKEFYPDTPFAFMFYDETIASFYAQERNTSRLIHLASGITVFISCLGLFGLAALTSLQRTKEVGIRKVMGATVGVIVKLLSADFLKLVLIAAIIAFPIAWWVMNQWLMDFAFRVDIKLWMFIAAGLSSCVIALITVSFQAVKAALANPVKSLKDE